MSPVLQVSCTSRTRPRNRHRCLSDRHVANQAAYERLPKSRDHREAARQNGHRAARRAPHDAARNCHEIAEGAPPTFGRGAPTSHPSRGVGSLSHVARHEAHLGLSHALVARRAIHELSPHDSLDWTGEDWTGEDSAGLHAGPIRPRTPKLREVSSSFCA